MFSADPPDPLDDLAQARSLDEADDVAAARPTLGRLDADARAWSDSRAFESLSRAAGVLATHLESATLVESILDLAIAAVGAERGIVWRTGHDDAEFVPLVARDVDGTAIEELERVSRTILLRGQAGTVVESTDALSDPGLREIPSVQQHRIRSVVCLPLTCRGERVGLLLLDHPAPAAFPAHARRFLEAFASLAGVALENARVHADLRRESAAIRRRLGPDAQFMRIVTASPLMLELLRQAAVVARSEGPVLLLGESGTGKELLARAIHEASPRAAEPFVAFNCAAVPADLVESTFFGHVRGAFTGAVRDVPGLFAEADRGTLLLDEIADLDLALQAKLLRVLQERRVRPVGGRMERPVDVRVVAATSRDLEAALSQGRFREDLYFRLDVLRLHLPPLRERREDIPLLVEHFRERRRAVANTPDSASPRFTGEALDYLAEQEWRGNVRELENLVHRACVLARGPIVDAADLRALRRRTPTSPTRDLGPSPLPEGVRVASLRIADQERLAIEQALARTGGNKTRAAELLGIHRNSLVRRMQRLQVESSLPGRDEPPPRSSRSPGGVP